MKTEALLLTCLLALMSMKAPANAQTFDKVPLDTEAYPYLSRYWKASIANNGDSVVAAYQTSRDGDEIHTFFWDRSARESPISPGSIDADYTGWTMFHRVSAAGRIGGLYRYNPSTTTIPTIGAAALAQNAQSAFSGETPVLLEGLKFPVVAGLSDEAAWISWDHGNAIYEILRLSSETGERVLLADALPSLQVEDLDNLSVRSTVSGPGTDTFVVNIDRRINDAIGPLAEYVTTAFAFLGADAFELPHPGTLLEDDFWASEDFRMTSINGDGSLVGGMFDPDGQGVGHPFLLEKSDDGYTTRLLNCATLNHELDEYGCVILGNARRLVVGTGLDTDWKESVALAWRPGSTAATPISSILNAAGLKKAIVGWELHSVEAMSADGSAMVGFGLDPQGLGSMWFARAPEGFSFAAVVSADCNLDERLGALDLMCIDSIGARDVLLDALGAVPGDLNGDGSVAFEDFLALSSSFGQPIRNYAHGDIDISGRVDFADFLLLADNYGSVQPPRLAVPEPTTGSLSLLIVWCIWWLRPRSVSLVWLARPREKKRHKTQHHHRIRARLWHGKRVAKHPSNLDDMLDTVSQLQICVGTQHLHQLGCGQVCVGWTSRSDLANGRILIVLFSIWRPLQPGKIFRSSRLMQLERVSGAANCGRCRGTQQILCAQATPAWSFGMIA